jgi:hypothetical protein
MEGHQLAVRLVRLAADGTPLNASGPRMSIGGSPSMPAEAPFGTVYLGEKFSSQLIVTNEGVGLHSVRVKVELQTSSQRVVLVGADSDMELPAGQTLPIQTIHDIREVGLHIVVCSVHYTNPVTNERKFARKFFKFTVVNPLSLKTKVTELPCRGLVLLEAQVQNVSGTGFILDTVRFEPFEPLYATTIDALDEDSELLAFLTDGLVISPSATPRLGRDAEYTGMTLGLEMMYQFVFVLVYPMVASAAPLGRLDISWRSESGEAGRLQTGQLCHPEGTSDTITTMVRGIPDRVTLNTPFEVLFIFKNGAEKDVHNMRLIYKVDKLDESSLVPLGNTTVHLGTLTALNTTRLTMHLLPIKAGLVEVCHFCIEFEDESAVIQRKPISFHILIET